MRLKKSREILVFLHFFYLSRNLVTLRSENYSHLFSANYTPSPPAPQFIARVLLNGSRATNDEPRLISPLTPLRI